MKWTRTQWLITGIVFVLVYSIVLTRWIKVPLHPKNKARDAVHGDAYSDRNTQSAAHFFLDSGFSKTTYLPMHGYTETGDCSPCMVYTHYPALPDILAGFYAHIWDSAQDQYLRIFPIVLSMLFFGLIFYILQKIIPDPRAAWLSGLIIVCSNYFIFWADTYHKHLYEELLKWGYLFLLYQYYAGERKQKVYLIVCAFIFIVITNMSFEPVSYLAVLTLGLSWIYTRRIISVETVLLGIMPFIGFGLHLWQNALYFESWATAINDMRHSAEMRTVGNDSHLNELKRTLNLSDYLSIPYFWLQRVERFFVLPFISLVVLMWFGMRSLKKEHHQLYQLTWVLIAATLSWNILMTQHSLVHIFTGRHIGILIAFIAGTGIIAYRAYLLQTWTNAAWWQKGMHLSLIGYTIAMCLSQQVYDYVRYGWGY
jgi:hypothetical protein